HPGDEGLLPLAQPGAVARKEEILRELLADGGGPGDDLALLLVSRARLLDRFPIEAFVVEKARVLRGHHGALEVRRDALVRHPLVPERRTRTTFPQRLQLELHESAHGRLVIVPV